MPTARSLVLEIVVHGKGKKDGLGDGECRPEAAKSSEVGEHFSSRSKLHHHVEIGVVL